MSEDQLHGEPNRISGDGLSGTPGEKLNGTLGEGPGESGLEELARSLAQGRPVPSPGFRGELGRLLRSVPLPKRVRHLRVKALGLAACGAALLALVGAGVAGSGPLAPSQTAASSAFAGHAH